MIPIQSTLTGIGPHENLEIPWDRLPSPIAILGDMGNGKTFALESIPFALYGALPFRSQESLYNQLTRGGDGKGEASLVFSHAGKSYVITRKITFRGKTRSHTAYLEEHTISNPSLVGAVAVTARIKKIAGPKIADVDRAISAILGPKKIFLATTFLSQARTGDLCGVPGVKDLHSYRREIFNHLLGTDALDPTHEKFADVARTTAAKAKILEEILAEQPNFADAIEQEQSALDLCELDLLSARTEADTAEADLEKLRMQLRDATTGDDALRDQVQRHERAKTGLESAITQRETIEERIEVLEKQAAKHTQAEADLAREVDLKNQRKKLTIQKRAWEEYLLWIKTEDKFQTDAKGSQLHLDDLQVYTIGFIEKQALALRYPELLEEHADATTENENIARKNRVLENRRHELTRQIATAQTKFSLATDSLNEKTKTLFGEDCDTCPYVEKYAKLPDQIKEAKDRLKDRKAEKVGISSDTPLKDLAEIVARGTEAHCAIDWVEKASGVEEKITIENTKLAQIKGNIKKHQHNAPEAVGNPTEKLAIIQSALDKLSGAQERLTNAENAVGELETAVTNLADAQETVAKAQKENDDTVDAARNASKTLHDREKTLRGLNTAIGICENKLAAIRHDNRVATENATKANTRLESLCVQQREQAVKRKKARALRARLKDLEDLRECFGPKGVRQVLLDNAVGELEDRADDLFQRATDGCMRLRIATQAVNQDGSTRETFDILVTDATGEADVLQYSGGEQQLIRILFRIAVALWQGQRAGHHPECLFLDEAFDNLGAKGTGDLFRVLDHLGTDIPLIVTITHDPAIAARHRSIIRMKKQSHGVHVEFQGLKEVA